MLCWCASHIYPVLYIVGDTYLSDTVRVPGNKVMQCKREVSWLRSESQNKSIKAILDVQNAKSLQLWCCLWLVRAPGPRVLALAIIFCSFGPGYFWWTVCFHAFRSSPVSWPVTQLSVWALRPCILDAYADCASSGKCIHVCKRVCVCVCVCVCVRARTHATVSLCTSLHGLWLPALSMSEVCARHAMSPFAVRDRSLVPPVAPGVGVGTTYDASTKAALPLLKQTCAIHTASALY